MRKYIWARIEVNCNYDSSHQSDGCPTAAFSDIGPPELCKTCGYYSLSESEKMEVKGMSIKAYRELLSTTKAILAIELQDRERHEKLQEEKEIFLVEIQAILQKVSEL